MSYNLLDNQTCWIWTPAIKAKIRHGIYNLFSWSGECVGECICIVSVKEISIKAKFISVNNREITMRWTWDIGPQMDIPSEIYFSLVLASFSSFFLLHYYMVCSSVTFSLSDHLPATLLNRMSSSRPTNLFSVRVLYPLLPPRLNTAGVLFGVVKLSAVPGLFLYLTVGFWVGV